MPKSVICRGGSLSGLRGCSVGGLMKKYIRICGLVGAAWLASCSVRAQAPKVWKAHDMDRPVPVAIDPGTASSEDKAGRPPADAVLLFDGKDLSKWAQKDGSAA